MPEPTARAPTKCRNFNALKEPRRGVMLHYDDSTSDPGAVAWFTDPECKVSYNYLVLDDGSYVPIVPEGKRAWHAGACKSSNSVRLPYVDANSAFVAVAVATNGKVPATAAQRDTVAWLARREFERNGWPLAETWRIVGHDSEAVWPDNAETPVHLRGKRGRKIDPTGPRPERPILSTQEVRALVAAGAGVSRSGPPAVADATRTRGTRSTKRPTKRPTERSTKRRPKPASSAKPAAAARRGVKGARRRASTPKRARTRG